VPTYNRRAKLARCLASLAAQTVPMEEFEVVIVDDGSTDDTAAFLREGSFPFRTTLLAQKNAGAGAARRLGVEEARAPLLLFANDDTLAAPELVAEHLRLQQDLHEACFAVLGTFEYEPAAARRALTYFVNATHYLFPQASMVPDVYYGPSQFVTCNLSIRRDAVLAARSFDPAFRVAEDTDLGLRLAALGVQVIHHPAARAWHDHLELTVAELVRRARSYGPAWLRLLEKHPALSLSQLGVELRPPVKASDVARVREALAPRRAQVDEIVDVLSRQDGYDFEALLAKGTGPGSAAMKVIQTFGQTLPMVHWFHVLDALCEAWEAGRVRAGRTAASLAASP
jgi:GT2 family glycosyltransferase